MKRISNFIVLTLLTGMFFTSCVKDRNVGPDFSSTSPVLELRTPINDIAGLAYFGRAAIGNLPDTVKFYANLASQYTMDHDINVTVGVDPTRLDTYNADAANVVKFQILPDSCFTLLKTAGTIVKGQRVDSFQIVFYKDKIDPTQNYMLPVAITDGSGVLLSSNQSVIWFHAIGNPIAGLYEQEWIRWNASDTSGDPTYDFDLGAVGFSPKDPTTVEIPSGSAGLLYDLSFTNTGGVLSNFQISFDQGSVDAAAAGGVTITSGPVIEVVDPVAGLYRFYFTYSFGGSPRQIIDQYVKL